MDRMMESVASQQEVVTLYFSWTIKSFKQIYQTRIPSPFESESFDVYPNCCSLCFTLKYSTKTDKNEDGSAKTSIVLEIGSKKKIAQEDVDYHLTTKHGFYTKISHKYLILQNGQKIAPFRAVYCDSLDGFNCGFALGAEQDISEILCDGSLEFRIEHRLLAMRHSRDTILGPPLPPESLAVNFGHMLETGSFSDFKILVNDDTINVHKMVLAARSPVFDRMLNIDMKEKNENSLRLDDLSIDVVKRFVGYIYTDKIDLVGSKEDEGDTILMELLMLADQYQMLRLKALCEIDLIRRLSTGNLVEVLKIADTYGAENLLCAGLKYLNLNKSIVSKNGAVSELVSHSKRLETSIVESLTGVKL